MAWARIKFLTPQAKILSLAASPLGQEFLPLGSRILFSPSPLGENPIFITSMYFCRVMAENQVKGFFVAPTALRAIKMADPKSVEGHKYNTER